MPKKSPLFRAALGVSFILTLSACGNLAPPVQGVSQDNLNQFYSTHNPPVIVTFADRFRYEGTQGQTHIYSGPDNSYIAVFYRKNPHRNNRQVDYYYPIDRVLSDNVSRNGDMAYRYGDLHIGDQKLYYCYSIHPEADQFQIHKNMVIQSQLQDWLLIVYGKRYSYSNFKADYDSAKAYFSRNPGQLAAFDTDFENAIVKIEKYTPQR